MNFVLYDINNYYNCVLYTTLQRGEIATVIWTA